MFFPKTLADNRFTRSVAIFLTAALLSINSHATTAGPAPEFNLPTKEGKISLANMRGKVVLLDFWASWCGPCRQSFPWMNDMQAKYRNQGFEVIAVNLDQEPDAAAEFLEKIPAAFSVAYDPDGITPQAYEVIGMPSAYLIDRDGRIHSQHIGFQNDRRNNYEAEIRRLLQIEQN